MPRHSRFGAFTRRVCSTIFIAWIVETTFIVFPHFSGEYCHAAENTTQHPDLRPNLDIMAEQVKQIGEEILANARVKDGDTISLVGDSIPDSWMVVNTFGETFRTHRCHVYRLSDSSIVPQYIVEFHLIGFDVRYENIFHSGLFGQKFLTRSVTTQLSYHVLGGLKKEIVAGNIVHKTSVDTVAIDAIPELENRTIKSTLGVLPSDPFLDKAVEPFIIIGAAGIAIYLLFHIRSS